MEVKAVARLWSEHFPYRKENANSKVLCSTVYYIVTGRAGTSTGYGSWADKLQQSITYYGIPKEEFDQFAKENDNP